MKIAVSLLFFGFITGSFASNDLARDKSKLETNLKSEDNTRNKKCNHKEYVLVSKKMAPLMHLLVEIFIFLLYQIIVTRANMFRKLRILRNSIDSYKKLMNSFNFSTISIFYRHFSKWGEFNSNNTVSFFKVGSHQLKSILTVHIYLIQIVIL